MQRDAEFNPATDADMFRHLFTSPVAGGLFGLSLPAAPAAGGLPSGRKVLDAAVALARFEPWLALFEEWLGAGLLPTLSAETDAIAERWMFSAHVCARHEESGARVFVPLAWLSATRKAPPAALAGWIWSSVQCELVMDTPPIQREDIDRFETGALLLLPGSFSSTWSARLQPRGVSDVTVAVQVSESHAQLCVTVLGSTAPSVEGGQARVCLAEPMTVTPAALFGWAQPGPASQPAQIAVGGAVSVCSAALDETNPLAFGQLVPMAEGYAVRLEQLVSRPSPTPV